ncbi:Type 1 glutamine amidotransferase-like domain-containing protein [Lysinibacillus sp. MHQ-1]|nr:Type 1 glutamine amidotransferase-like domain-containing protein [Lysinibacillus sp. MHQ-1]
MLGAMCWFDKCFSENQNNHYEEYNGLGILSGTFCPHYDDPERSMLFNSWLKK